MDKRFLVIFVFICLSAVKCDPKDYINYKGEFAQISYNNNGVNTNKTVSNEDKSYLNISQHHVGFRSEDQINLQQLISSFTNTLKNVFEYHNKTVGNLYNATHKVGNKTKILVNAFNLHDLLRDGDKVNESLAVESNYMTPVFSKDVIIPFSESVKSDPVASSIKDRFPKSIFSKSFLNDFLSEPISEEEQGNEEILNTETTPIYPTLINQTQKSIITDNSSNGEILSNKNINLEKLKTNYENSVLNEQKNMKIDLLSENTKNETPPSKMRNHPLLMKEDVSLESLFNSYIFMSMSDSEDAFLQRNNSTKSDRKINNDITQFNPEGEETFNISDITTKKQAPAMSIIYDVKTTDKLVNTSTQTPKQPYLESTVEHNKTISTVDESEKRIHTEIELNTISSINNSNNQSENIAAHTPTTKISFEVTSKTSELMSSTAIPKIEISTHSPAATTQKMSKKEIEEVNKTTECKKDTKPSIINEIINEMKIIKVDQILILVPLVPHIKQNLTAIQNATKKATNATIMTPNITKSTPNVSKTPLNISESNLANNPMNKHLKTHADVKYEFDTKEILKRDKENEVYDDTNDIEDILNDNSTADYLGIDYVDYYKDIVLEDVVLTTTESKEADNIELVKSEVEHNILQYALQSSDMTSNNHYARSVHACHGNATTMPDTVFPWIVTIFHKNGNTDQFEYFCDGVLLSNKAVLTTARCVMPAGDEADESQLIVILGKRNLKTMHEHEVVVRVSKLIIHPDFHQNSSSRFIEDDLAIIVLDSVVPESSSSFRTACLDCPDCGPVEQSSTTGWALTGELTPIFFQKEDNESDIASKKIEGTYGLDVSVCPSHGGIYFVQLQGAWYVRGISASNPNDQGICIIRTLQYTSLTSYLDWINDVINKLN